MSIRRNGAKVRDNRHTMLNGSRELVSYGNSGDNRAVADIAVLAGHCGGSMVWKR